MDTSTGSSTGSVDWSAITGYSGNTQETSSQNDMLDQEVFVELLVTQLQYQDPLSPMENQEFTAQLAALSQVEQLRNANTNLETLQLYQSSINNAQSVSLIGKQVKALGDSFKLDQGESVSLSYNAASDAEKGRITIFGPEGDVVRTLEISDIEEGLNTAKFDGRDNNGSELPGGRYSFQVTLEDADGGSVESYTLVCGQVKGVQFDSGVPVLDIEGQKVSIGDIYEVIQ